MNMDFSRARVFFSGSIAYLLYTVDRNDVYMCKEALLDTHTYVQTQEICDAYNRVYDAVIRR